MAINVIAIIYDISFKKSLPESLYNCYKCTDKDENIKTHSRSPKPSRPARPGRPFNIQDENIKIQSRSQKPICPPRLGCPFNIHEDNSITALQFV